MIEKYRIISFIGILILLSSCAGGMYSQEKLVEIDNQLVNYIVAYPLDHKAVSIPKQYPDVPQLPVKIAVIFEASEELKFYPNADNFFYQSTIDLLKQYFEHVEPMGIAKDKLTINKLTRQIIEGQQADYILVVSDIRAGVFYGHETYLYRKLVFHYELINQKNNVIENQVLAGYEWKKTVGEMPEVRDHLISVVIASIRELEKSLIEKRAQEFRKQAQLAEEERRKKAQLAEEERLRQELMAKLKAKREQFLVYGFDVLEFVKHAKSSLRIKYDIDFGGAVPEIDFRTFKGKKYVEVKVNYPVTFNTLKVSMYESASMTFDEIVKKLAIRISSDFKKQGEIAGFIFNVTYTNKDFLEKLDVPRIVNNEFVLPKEACRQYVNLDITNQDLINQSIVLVDGERISLNLQISK